jgi:hypothetical protein
MKVLLAATTSAGDSEEFEVANNQRPATFTAPGLAGSETATIQKKASDGNFYDSYQDGVRQEITATHTETTVYGAGYYRVHKSATASAVFVDVSTDDNP